MSSPRSPSFACFAAIVAFGIPAVSASAATLDGATIRATASFPVLAGPTVTGGPVDAVVGAGVEFSTGQFGAFFGPSFDFSGSTLTITHLLTGHQAADFNGYTFNDVLGVLGDFTGFSILSDNTGLFDLTRISFDAENLFVNFQSLSFEGFEETPTIVLGIEVGGPAPIPLPASLPLLVAGLGALAFARRRRS